MRYARIYGVEAHCAPQSLLRASPGWPSLATRATPCVAPLVTRATHASHPSERFAARAIGQPKLICTGGREVEVPTRLAFGELRAATRLATTDFLAFDFTRIAGDESCLA